jgi:hypothetical protein
MIKITAHDRTINDRNHVVGNIVKMKELWITREFLERREKREERSYHEREGQGRM